MLFGWIVPQVVGEAREPVKRDVVVSINTELDHALPVGLAIPGVLPTDGEIFSVDLRKVVRLLDHQTAIESPPEAGDIQGVDGTAVHFDGSRSEDLSLLPGIEEGRNGDEEKKAANRGKPRIGLDQAKDAKDRARDTGPGG